MRLRSLQALQPTRPSPCADDLCSNFEGRKYLAKSNTSETMASQAGNGNNSETDH